MKRMRHAKFTASCIALLLASSCGSDTLEPTQSQQDSGVITQDTGHTSDTDAIPKDTSEPEDTDEPQDTAAPEDTSTPEDTSDPEDTETPIPNVEDTIVVGNGSGQLIIKDLENKVLSIMPGTYWNINFENLKNVQVYGFDNVTVKGGDINIRNVDGLLIRGLEIREYGQAVINVHDSADNLTLQDLKINDISNYVIKYNINKRYDGTPESFSENIHLINIQADNIGTLFVSSGGFDNDGYNGLIRGFKLTRSSITNSPHLSNGVYINLVEDYEISHNRIDNVNKSEEYPDGNNNHNGIFHVIGNGKLFGNKVTNHQGNMVRAWLMSITKPDAVVEIYDNTVYNSTRYSAFELQVTPWMEELTTFKPAHAKVYNNTAGKLNTGEPKYYEGRVLDLYGTHGNLEIYDNLYFNMRDDHLMLNMSGSTNITRETGNQYFENADDAVEDLVNFKSKIPGIGAR